MRGRLRPQGRESVDRRSVQIGRAPASALKSRTRLLSAEAVAGEQLLRLCLRKSEHLFGNHEQALLAAESPHRRRRQTPPQNKHVYISWNQQEQTVEEWDYPIGVIDQLQVVDHRLATLRPSLHIIDKGFRQLRDVGFDADPGPANSASPE